MSARLDELVHAAAQAPAAPDLACDSLIARFLPKGPQGDDVALLCLRLEPKAVPTLDLTLPDSGEEVARVRSALRDWLPRAGATDDAETEDLVLAVCEALAAHPQSPGGEPRRLAVTLVGDRVEAVVCASGPPPPPDGTDRGRGFVLLNAVRDAFGIEHEGGATEVRLVRRLSRAVDDETRPPYAARSDEHGLVVPPEPMSVPVCRRYVQERLSDATPRLIENAELCVSELVTNAVLHTGTRIEVRVERRGDVARLEVRDRSSVPPSRSLHSEGATTGRGLEMVAGVARAWGVEPLGEHGKAVWCEVTADASASTDVQSVLDSWSDLGQESLPGGTDSEPQRGAIVLRDFPVILGARAREHVESLLRECMLLVQAAQRQSIDAPSALDELAATLRSYVQALEALERQRAVASARGESSTDLVVAAPTDRGDARAWQAALAHLHRYTESGELLTPPPSPEVAYLHGWVLAEVTAQSQGAEPRAWDGPVA